MKINTYENVKIVVVDDPYASYYNTAQSKIKLACDLTMKKVNMETYKLKSASQGLIKNLFNSEHNSIFEHCNITLLASGLSRSLLAQITRQGTFRFTSASQHYQDYREYPLILRPGWEDKPNIAELYEHALQTSLNTYIDLIEAGEKPEEARQILPNACAVDLLITANARNIARFLSVRLCKRNVEEMTNFAEKMMVVCQKWIPELFTLVGAPCAMTGKCNQGKMSCGEPYEKIS